MIPYRWTKLGRPFIPQQVTGRPWLASFAQAPATLLLEDRLRVYFSCRPPADANGQFTSFSAFVDLDRQDPMRVLAMAEQPILPLGERGCFDEFGTYPVSVIRDGEQLRAYYAGWTRCESVPFDTAIGMATSRDGGVSFQKLGPGPVLAASLHEPFVISGPKIRRFNDRWYLWYIAGRVWKMHEGRAEPVYKIRMAISDDGVHWERQNRDLIESRIELDEAQASPDVIEANGRFHMFFCYRHSTDFRSGPRGYRIGYAHSTDLLHWTRDDAQAGLDVSAEGWDSEMVAYPHVFELEGRTYMGYLGNGVGREGFGLARLEGTL
ncbi:MAG: hypothetical protein ACK5O3_00870 [Burkholderiales bacterium]